MKKALFLIALVTNMIAISAQSGFNYYKDSVKNGSSNDKAFTYFKKAYYDCIWNWTIEGADSAEYYLKLSIKEDSNYTAAYAFLAHVYQFKTYKAEDFDKYFALQKKYAEKAVSFHPLTGDAYSVMADVTWTEHDTSTTFSLLRDAIAREPENVGNYLWIAIRYRQMRQEKYFDSAVYSLRHIMELDPEYGQAYIKLGNVYHLDKHLYDSAKVYYRKTIDVYNNIKPRDNRMMDAYYWLGEVYKTEKKYDSAIYYYGLFLNEMEPSDMYIKDMRLSATYKALYECQQFAANKSLQQFLAFSTQRIKKDPTNTNLLLEILERNYIAIEQDSVYEKYALPLARYIQTVHSTERYVQIFAVDDEFIILKKLKRNNEALKVLLLCYAKNPNEPIILFDLGRIHVVMNNPGKGMAFLNKAKQNVNKDFTNEVFIDQLKDADFDKVRNTTEFKKLIK